MIKDSAGIMGQPVKFSKIDQIGIVVKNVEAALKCYEKLFGVALLPIVTSKIIGAKLKIGLLPLAEIQIEHIQVLEGESLHSEFLEKKGEGLHHLGFLLGILRKTFHL